MRSGSAPTADWLPRQIAKLEELADLGLAMARACKEAACDSETVKTAAETERLYLAYDRAARAVRLAILLQDRLLNAPVERDAVAEKTEAVRRTVMRIDQRTRPMTNRISRELPDRLDHDFLGDVMGRPFSELVAMICQDMGLKPDWSELAQEGWARDELESGPVGWPLRGLAAADPNPAAMAAAAARTGPAPRQASG